MSWLLLTIIGAVALSASRVLQRVLLKNVDSDSFAFSFIFPLLVSVALLGYISITKTFELPNLSAVWLNMVLMIIFYAIGSICVYRAYKESPASEVSIIIASTSVWSVLSAIIFLGEKLITNNIIGIICIFLGVVVINYQKTKWKLESGHIYGLIGALMFGVGFTNDALIINHFQNVPSYLFLIFLLPSLAILLYRPNLVKKLPYFFSKAVIGKLFLTATIYALSAIAIYTAYKIGGKASIIIPIQQTNIVLTVILSYFLLNEKDKLIQKVIGALLVFGGALLLI